MRISYFNYLYDLDGASLGSAVKARRLFGALAERGHQVNFHWRNRWTHPRRAEARPSLATRMRRRLSPWLNFPASVARSFKELAPECRLVRQDRSDLLIARLEAGRFSAPLLGRIERLPLIVEADAPVCYELRRFVTERHLPPRLPEWLELFTLSTADAVFTPSDVMRDYFVARGVPEERIVTIENGADGERFRPRPAGETVRGELGLGDRTVVGFSGSLAPWHDVGALLQAFTAILENDRSVVLLVVGSGGGDSRLMDHWASVHETRGRLVRISHAEHERMPAIMSAMDVVLMPAPPLPLPYFSPVKLFEAMASGGVVVAARQGQPAQIVRDGENGFLYTPGDVGEMVRVTLAALEHPDRDSIARAARETIVPRFTWENQARRLEELLMAVLTNHQER